MADVEEVLLSTSALTDQQNALSLIGRKPDCDLSLYAEGLELDSKS